MSLAEILAPTTKTGVRVTGVRESFLLLTKKKKPSLVVLLSDFLHHFLVDGNTHTHTHCTGITHPFVPEEWLDYQRHNRNRRRSCPQCLRSTDPVENLVNGLVVSGTDVQLDRVYTIALRANLVPVVRPLGVEILIGWTQMFSRREQTRSPDFQKESTKQ